MQTRQQEDGSRGNMQNCERERFKSGGLGKGREGCVRHQAANSPAEVAHVKKGEDWVLGPLLGACEGGLVRGATVLVGAGAVAFAMKLTHLTRAMDLHGGLIRVPNRERRCCWNTRDVAGELGCAQDRLV